MKNAPIALLFGFALLNCNDAPPTPTLNPAPEAPEPKRDDAVAPIAVPVAAVAPMGPALKPQVDSFKGWFEKLEVTFEQSPMADGTPRLMGKSEDGMTMVELIGHGQRLEQASLMFGLAKDAPGAMIRNTGAVMVFMRETGWEKGWKWATNAIGSKDPVTKRHDDVAYEMITIADTGVSVLTAKPFVPEAAAAR
jgi:hypothetical protein